MRRRTLYLVIPFAVSIVLFSSPPPAQSGWIDTERVLQEEITGENRVAVTLIPEIAGFFSAETGSAEGRAWFWLGVQMDILDGWHVYWRNPGDSGLPTRISWENHDYLIPGDIHWPVPSRFDEEGITTYGYSKQVTLLVPVYVSARSASFSTGQTAPMIADMDWLVCKDICLPESARIKLKVDRRGHLSGYSDKAEATISEALQKLPAATEIWEGSAVYGDGSFLISIRPVSGAGISHGSDGATPGADGATPGADGATPGADGATPGSDGATPGSGTTYPATDGIYFYPYRQGLIEHTAPQSVSRTGNSIQIKLKASRYLRAMPEEITGIFSAEEYWIEGSGLTAIELSIPVSQKNALNP